MRRGRTFHLHQRGFTLIEMLVCAGIAGAIGAAAIGFSSGQRPLAAQTAADLFDAQLAHARSIAAGNGGAATLAFTAAASGSGTIVTLSPQSGAPPERLAADVSEASLGTPPFSLTVDAGGHVVASPSCPAGGGFTLVFTGGPATQSRYLACAQAISGPPEPLGTVPP